VRSRTGVAAGAVIALIVPVSTLVLAQLIDVRIAPYGLVQEWFPAIGGLLWASLLILGPVGIAIAGWSAGLSGWGRWLALLVWSLPLYAFLWFGSAARFSGTMGNPF
jgi:hypothetical protein